MAPLQPTNAPATTMPVRVLAAFARRLDLHRLFPGATPEFRITLFLAIPLLATCFGVLGHLVTAAAIMSVSSLLFSCSLLGWSRRRQYQILTEEEGRASPGSVLTNVGFELVTGKSVNDVDVRVGLYFEHSDRGGLEQYYGYPEKYWAVLVCCGHKTLSFGLTWGRMEFRLHVKD